MATNPIIARSRRLEVTSDRQISKAPAGVVLKAAGCRGLFLENRTATAGVWRFRAADPTGARTQVQARIGEWPAMGIEEAVIAALTIRSDLKAGRRPSLEREKKQAAVEARLEAERAQAQRQTVEVATKAYLATRKEGKLAKRGLKALKRPQQLAQMLAYINAAAITAGRFGDLEVGAVTPAHVDELHETLTTERGPVLANRAVSRLRSFYRWAARPAGPVPGYPSPVEGVALNDEEERDRVLDDDELRAVWQAATELGYPHGDFVKVLLWTACRGGEIMRLRWSKDPTGQHGHYNAAAQTLEFAGAAVKNGTATVTYLPTQAVALLDSLPRFAGSEYVFRPRKCSEFRGHVKEKIDALAGVKAWVLHDIRRTVCSHLAALGIAPAVAAKILNHTSEGPVKGTLAIYMRHQYVDERRAALQAWADRLDSVVNNQEPTP